MTKPDYEKFTAEIMQFWPWGDVDGFSLQEIAEKYGVIAQISGGFDPDLHDDPTGASERGDPFYRRNYGAYLPKKVTGGPMIQGEASK